MSATIIAEILVRWVRNLSFEELRSVAELLCDPSEMFGGLEAHPARLDSALETVDVATPAARATS
jgi:hypothetical protein